MAGTMEQLDIFAGEIGKELLKEVDPAASDVYYTEKQPFDFGDQVTLRHKGEIVTGIVKGKGWNAGNKEVSEDEVEKDDIQAYPDTVVVQIEGEKNAHPINVFKLIDDRN